jgi:hypothetical protein
MLILIPALLVVFWASTILLAMGTERKTKANAEY